MADGLEGLILLYRFGSPDRGVELNLSSFTCLSVAFQITPLLPR